MQHIVSYKPFIETVDRYAVYGLSDVPAKKPTNVTSAVVFVGQKMMRLNCFVKGQEGLRGNTLLAGQTGQARLVGCRV